MPNLTHTLLRYACAQQGKSIPSLDESNTVVDTFKSVISTCKRDGFWEITPKSKHGDCVCK